jgi:hypothetical protein
LCCCCCWVFVLCLFDVVCFLLLRLRTMRTRTMIPIAIKRSTPPITPPTMAINLCESEWVWVNKQSIDTHTKHILNTHTH